jgi:hypothetical protein
MRDGTIQVFSVGSRFAFLNDRGSTGKVKTGSEILGGPERETTFNTRDSAKRRFADRLLKSKEPLRGFRVL